MTEALVLRSSRTAQTLRTYLYVYFDRTERLHYLCFSPDVQLLVEVVAVRLDPLARQHGEDQHGLLPGVVARGVASGLVISVAQEPVLQC